MIYTNMEQDVNFLEIKQKCDALIPALQQFSSYVLGNENMNGVGYQAKWLYRFADDFDSEEKRDFAEELIQLGNKVSRLIGDLDDMSDWCEQLKRISDVR